MRAPDIDSARLDGAKHSLSEDKQSLLWSEQSASISRLHSRIEILEAKQQTERAMSMGHDKQIDTLNEDQFSLHERVAALELGPVQYSDCYPALLKRMTAIEAGCEHCLREGKD